MIKTYQGHPILWQPNSPPQTEFLSRQEDVTGFGGAKGPGKTDGLFYGALRFISHPKYKAVILRRTFPRLQEIIDRSQSILPSMGAKWNGELHRWNFPSGAFLEFDHCHHEESKRDFQGKEYHYIGFDQLEEFSESQFDFICAANRTSIEGIPCRIRWTANPGGPGHWWVKRRFIDGKVSGQTYKQEFTLPNGKTVTRTFCFIRGIAYDNPALDPTYIATLMSLPEADRKALLEGDWDVYVTECVFDHRGMQMQENKCVAPEWTGYLSRNKEFIEFHEDRTGNIRIWEEPRDGDQYQIGSDASSGIAGDPASCHVINKRTWGVAAKWSGYLEPKKYAEVLCLLSLYYNIAEIAQENDKNGAVVISRLMELNASLYQSQPGRYGWESNQTSRSHMISTLRDAVADNATKVRDRETLDEMYNFIRNPENGKMEARAGCHDDDVVSLGIALQTARVNPMEEDGEWPIRTSSVAPIRKVRERRSVAA